MMRQNSSGNTTANLRQFLTTSKSPTPQIRANSNTIQSPLKSIMKQSSNKYMPQQPKGEQEIYMSHSFHAEDRSLLEYNLRARTALNRYFTGWISHHSKQKEKWSSLIKYRYLVSRMHLNKIFWGWKLHVRKQKVNKLKTSIIEHNIYKNHIRACFRGWRDSNSTEKMGIKKLDSIAKKRMKRIVIKLLQHLKEDQQIKVHNNSIAKDFNLAQALLKGFKSF